MNRCDAVDLRHAFDLTAAFDGDADGSDNDPDERDPDSSPPAEPTSPTDTAGGEGNGDAEAPDNPEMKRLHDEAARHRVRAKTAEDQVTTLTEEVRSLRLRLAFNEAAGTCKITDTEAAWKLSQDDLRTVGVDDDGTTDTDRMGQVVAHVAKRYPYLAAQPAPTPEDRALQDRFPALAPSGRSTERRRRGRGGVDEQHLASKFPALRRR